MVRSVLYLRQVSGGPGAIERFFAAEGVLERTARIPGFLGAELQVPDDEEAPALVTALWQSRQAYRTWVEDPWRAQNAKRAAAVFTPVEGPDGGGSLYEVAIAVGPIHGRRGSEDREP